MTEILQTPVGKNANTHLLKNDLTKDMIDRLSDITLHQLSIALLQKRTVDRKEELEKQEGAVTAPERSQGSIDSTTLKNVPLRNIQKNITRCVALLSFYSFSLNSPIVKQKIILLSPECSRKGKMKEASSIICFLLSLCSKKYLNGRSKRKQEWEDSTTVRFFILFSYILSAFSSDFFFLFFSPSLLFSFFSYHFFPLFFLYIFYFYFPRITFVRIF